MVACTNVPLHLSCVSSIIQLINEPYFIEEYQNMNKEKIVVDQRLTEVVNNSIRTVVSKCLVFHDPRKIFAN